MQKFAQVGPQAHQKTVLAAAGGDAPDPENDYADSLADNDSVVAPGEINPKEYDYLLSMPMWSLTEERVNQLLRQMHDKKDEHDALNAKTIYQLWSEDLDAFIVELDKVWEQ